MPLCLSHAAEPIRNRDRIEVESGLTHQAGGEFLHIQSAIHAIVLQLRTDLAKIAPVLAGPSADIQDGDWIQCQNGVGDSLRGAAVWARPPCPGCPSGAAWAAAPCP